MKFRALCAALAFPGDELRYDPNSLLAGSVELSLTPDVFAGEARLLKRYYADVMPICKENLTGHHEVERGRHP